MLPDLNTLPTSLLGLFIFVIVALVGFVIWQGKAVVGLLRNADLRLSTLLQFVQNHMEHDQAVLIEIKGHMAAQTILMSQLLGKKEEVGGGAPRGAAG